MNIEFDEYNITLFLMGVNNIQPISPIMVNIRECVMRPCVLHKVKENL